MIFSKASRLIFSSGTSIGGKTSSMGFKLLLGFTICVQIERSFFHIVIGNVFHMSRQKPSMTKRIYQFATAITIKMSFNGPHWPSSRSHSALEHLIHIINKEVDEKRTSAHRRRT